MNCKWQKNCKSKWNIVPLLTTGQPLTMSTGILSDQGVTGGRVIMEPTGLGVKVKVYCCAG